ncbi:hypothetical protein [Crenalkalicoccus roseus]|uniref:hypothetical protein n=1 Tax=Crenalkalicoccus roseus TaxID=1485588 RepID=UPI0010805F34|nr:hypothetical protein [Crenalkalicoccus roseus]
MSLATKTAEAESETVDQAALRLMLSYVEAECLRIGATEAARHAALAAAMMPGAHHAAPPDATLAAARRNSRLH